MNMKNSTKMRQKITVLNLDRDNIDEEANEPLCCNNGPRTSTAVGQTMNLRTFDSIQ